MFVIDTARWHEVYTASAVFSLVLYGGELFLDRQILQDYQDMKTITHLGCIMVILGVENDQI